MESIKSRLRAYPEVLAWPEIVALLDRPARRTDFNCWDYPGIAARSVGGTVEVALPAAAAIFCSLASIHLVDDMLDEDPRGAYHVWGNGRTANIALALQAFAARVLDEEGMDPARRSLLQQCLAKMTIATCWGQQLDAGDLEGEEAYWQVVRLKTPPLFGCALELGALLGGAEEGLASRIGSLGTSIGEIVQVSDDLKDAMEVPACPDWFRRGGNLAILYARLAAHPERERFEVVRLEAGQEAGLKEAQDLLVRSGAVSYGAYSILESYKRAQKVLRDLPLVDAAPLTELIESHISPLLELLRTLGIETPEALLDS